MSRKAFCFCCMVKGTDSNSNYEIAVEEPTPEFDAVMSIWREKMEKSKLFIPAEIEIILPIWIAFIRSRIQCYTNIDAEEFYVETAELAARKLKHFPEHRWECFRTQFPIDSCSKDTLNSLNQQSPKHPPNDNETPSTSSSVSAQSTSDVAEQVEFLLQLVGSSNFNMSLVKTALDPSFQRSHIEMKSPQQYLLPKKYLEIDPQELLTREIRTNLLNGVYDEYILPLQIANEVNDEFWTQLENEDA